MTTITLRGNQIGEALQFQENGSSVTVEIGRVWFSATDTVTLTAAPGVTPPSPVPMSAARARSSG